MQPMHQILTGPLPIRQGQPGAPPNPNVPTQGQPQGSPNQTDPVDYGYATTVTALKRLEQELNQAGRAVQANEVGGMAVKLNKLRLKDKEQFAQAQALLTGQQAAARL
ncbi:MAG TPA: hypothetical protein V6C86_24155 [Oculatellaceae cyanobacterium]